MQLVDVLRDDHDPSALSSQPVLAGCNGRVSRVGRLGQHHLDTGRRRVLGLVGIVGNDDNDDKDDYDGNDNSDDNDDNDDSDDL